MLPRNPSMTGENTPLAGGGPVQVLAHSGGSGTHHQAAAAALRGGGGWLMQPRPSNRALVLAAGALVLLAFCGGWQFGASSSSSRDAEAFERAVWLARGQPAMDGGAAAAAAAAGSETDAAASAATQAAKQPPGDQQSPASPCAYGSLPGVWVDGGPPGTRWQLLDARCRLRNLLARYKGAAADGEVGSGDGADQSSEGDGASSSSSSPPPPLPPPLRLLLLSDSVDRYLAGYLCGWAGGAQRAHVASDALPAGGVDAAAATAAAAAADAALEIPPSRPAPGDGGGGGGGGGAAAAESGKRRRRTLHAQRQQQQWRQQTWRQRQRRRLHQEQQQAAAPPASPAAAAEQQPAQQQQQPTNVYATAYSLHECVLPAAAGEGAGAAGAAPPPLRVASSYFPGVHPAGPWHRNVTQSYRARIDSAAALWREYAGGAPPDLVAVSSLLWDLARLWFHERGAVSGPALDPGLVAAWAANFTEVVAYARRAFPEAKVFVTHTTLAPRVDALTGAAVKPYLGRAYYVEQLNAAAADAVRRINGNEGGGGGDTGGGASSGVAGLGLVDYAAVGARFAANQSYLADLIHPGRDVGLELANVYLNLALQAVEAAGTGSSKGE